MGDQIAEIEIKSRRQLKDTEGKALRVMANFEEMRALSIGNGPHYSGPRSRDEDNTTACIPCPNFYSMLA
ncbi:hypothetical protein TNCV_1501041 [Trichonephila clavipes]|uniref:Uncharacterized protein n=1 Tax=Trichonephila clavipes TaxID=2585209 RepID=A0A8X6RW31_TRICX|nr:hypothetical protein TNCV_1501041 [Trichonephila clavipes]